MDTNKGQIILYQTVDEESKIEVTLANETVWLKSTKCRSCSNAINLLYPDI